MNLALLAPPAPVSRRPTSASRGEAPAAPRGRTVINKRGLLAPLLGPIGVAAGLVIVGVPAIAIWNIRTASEERNAVHEAPAPRDTTVAETTVRREVADGETEFVLRLIDGKLVRVIAAKDATTAFLNETLVALDAARAEAHLEVGRGLDQLFASVFATRSDDIGAYADWFFDWGRSWRLLYEALTGAVEEAARLSFSQTQITDAARHAVEAYLIRHYQDLVLKPELRDDAIGSGARLVLADAHTAYLGAVARLEDRMQRFLAEKTRYVAEIESGAVAVSVDWDAAKWRAPTGGAEDRYLEPVASAAVIGGGAVVGSMIQRAAVPYFARATAQVMVSARMTLGGAAVGSVQPGLGTAIGALAGAALDWGLSEFQEYMERDDFVRDNEAALDATIVAWKGRIEPEIGKAIDAWFDDARAVIAAQAASAD